MKTLGTPNLLNDAAASLTAMLPQQQLQLEANHHPQTMFKTPLEHVSFPLLRRDSTKDDHLTVATVYPSPPSSIRSLTPHSTRLVAEIMEEKLSQLVEEEVEEDAFFVADMGEIHRQYKRWIKNLPRIEPFYAIKCNPDPMILQELVSLGIGFDCASRNEIATVLQFGIDPARIIYANPCKQSSHIRYAQQSNVRMMTFDNAEELHKVKKVFPNAQLVLRILTDDSRSVCRFGTKFGACLSKTRGLLELAKSLELNVIGVSFHVGSGCFDAMAFHDAVVRARKVFDQGQELGFQFTLLDVGGGFPGNCEAQIPFEAIAKVLGPAVDEMFPPSVRVIAEPGRYFAASAFSLAVNITARRTVIDDSKAEHEEDRFSYMYYVNDGVYGSFNCILFDHAVVKPKLLARDGQFLLDRHATEEERHFRCSIWGPTCDSMDCITKDATLPELQVGDWLFFDTMGAYTSAAASTFNGFKRSTILYTNTELQQEYHHHPHPMTPESDAGAMEMC